MSSNVRHTLRAVVCFLLLFVLLAALYKAAFFAWVTMTPDPDVATAKKMFYLCALVALASTIGIAAIATRAVRDYLRAETPDVCRTCGYNLTGNVKAVCPECGNATTTR